MFTFRLACQPQFVHCDKLACAVGTNEVLLTSERTITVSRRLQLLCQNEQFASFLMKVKQIKVLEWLKYVAYGYYSQVGHLDVREKM